MVKTKLLLSSRIYKCSICGLVLDRDVNAARNLAWYGLQVVTGQTTEIPRGSYTDDISASDIRSKQAESKTNTNTSVSAQAAALPEPT